MGAGGHQPGRVKVNGGNSGGGGRGRGRVVVEETKSNTPRPGHQKRIHVAHLTH